MNKYDQPDLPYFEELDLKEAEERHKQSMARRWFFGYYLKCKDEKKKHILIDQYNKIARSRQKE